VTDDLGFAVPVSRRDLTALRGSLDTVRTGAPVTATFRTAEHGRFTVSGRVRRDLTDTAFKVGWWDLTTGKGTDPVADLQSLTTASTDEEAPRDAPVTDADELREVIATLGADDVVTADFDFERCGPFTISGGVRHDQSGTAWVLAGHFLGRAGVPAPRLRHLAVDRNGLGAEVDGR
jgi:hypothetical protein